MEKNWKNSLSFSIAVPKGIQRFRELIVYISSKSVDDQHFGATKLNKILYHSDFRAFQKFGIPLTGMTYFRLPKGPAPKCLLAVQKELETEGAIKVVSLPITNSIVQKRTMALRDAHLDHFSQDEIELVNSVIEELWLQNASEVSDVSHDVRWKILCNKDDIPYEFANLDDGAITESEIARTHELAKQYGWMDSFRTH